VGTLRRTEELILRSRQSEIFPKRLALIFAPEQAPALQLGNNLVDEVLKAPGHVRKHDVEAVASIVEKPLLHFIGDRRWRADECEPAEAACDLSELSDR
jgi:hypothetical protein